jgi:hypothetical protein
MPLIMTGQIAAIRRGEFDGKKFTSLQFTSTDRYGGLRLDTIYVDEAYEAALAGYKVGQDVEIPVTASVKKGTNQISFRMHDPAVEAQRPARPPLTVAK